MTQKFSQKWLKDDTISIFVQRIQLKEEQGNLLYEQDKSVYGNYHFYCKFCKMELEGWTFSETYEYKKKPKNLRENLQKEENQQLGTNIDNFSDFEDDNSEKENNWSKFNHEEGLMPTNEFEGKPNPRKPEYKQKEERYSLRQNNSTTAKNFLKFQILWIQPKTLKKKTRLL